MSPIESCQKNSFECVFYSFFYISIKLPYGLGYADTVIAVTIPISFKLLISYVLIKIQVIKLISQSTLSRNSVSNLPYKPYKLSCNEKYYYHYLSHFWTRDLLQESTLCCSQSHRILRRSYLVIKTLI